MGIQDENSRPTCPRENLGVSAKNLGNSRPPRELSELSETVLPRWAVARCGGADTLEIEAALLELGVTAWVPKTWVVKRVPRKRIKQLTKVPVLPSYVFFDARRSEVVRTVLRGKYSLSLMVLQGRLVELSDPDLEGLRAFDRRIRPRMEQAKAEAPTPKAPVVFKVGDRVKVKSSLFPDLVGVVEKVSGADLFIAVEKSSVRLQFPGFLVEPV